jgi:flagellar biosynthesis GTPase FlhF
LQALPPEVQEEYRQEVEEAQRKQEADLRKQQEAELHRQQAERNAELRRQQAERDAAEMALRAEESRRRQAQQAEDNRRQLEQIRLATEQEARADAEWNARVHAATNEVPEEAAITNRYPALQAIVAIIKVITIIAIVLVWLAVLGMWVGVASASPQIGLSALPAVLLTLLAIFWSVLIWAFGFAQAELILLAIDVSNDMRINRFLLKAIRYQRAVQHNANERTARPAAPPALPVQDVDEAVFLPPMS